MTTEELQRSLSASSLTRSELARRLRIDRRTVAKWFDHDAVPSKYEQQVREVLREDSGLGSYTDGQLVRELARRLEEYRLAADMDHEDGSRQEVEPVPGQTPVRGKRGDRPTSTSVEGKAGPHSSPRLMRQ